MFSVTTVMQQPYRTPIIKISVLWVKMHFSAQGEETDLFYASYTLVPPVFST